MIQYPARNSLDSGNTPSVMGSPSLPARTILASLGHAKPSVATKTPESLSSLLNARMKATFAWRSCLDHLAYPSKSDFRPLIIKMYFMSLAPFDAHPVGAFSWSSRIRTGILYVPQGFFSGRQPGAHLDIRVLWFAELGLRRQVLLVISRPHALALKNRQEYRGCIVRTNRGPAMKCASFISCATRL